MKHFNIGLAKSLILGAIVVAMIGLVMLGNWQMSRLNWKLALIERVENRAYATPVAPPRSSDWSSLSPETQEYRRVVTRGRYLHAEETLVWALTEQGNGYWVLTPLRTDTDAFILINRGYVPIDRVDPTLRQSGQIEGEVTVTGLLRLSEPGGTRVRDNDPAAERWYSRDVEAIATARKLTRVAPYFIDADATPNPGGYPVGGMTRLSFRNAHLVYALTWYGLALLLGAMTLYVIRIERKA